MDLLAVGLVALGGALGSVCRFLVQVAMARIDADHPLGTLTVNILGSFVIGFLWPSLDRLAPSVRPLVVIGFLGGFTTMSSYAAEVVSLAHGGRGATALGYAVLGAGLAVLAAFAGYAVATRS